MNNIAAVNKGRDLEAKALRLLWAIPGLAVRTLSQGADPGHDLTLEFGDTDVRVAVEVKHRANPATAWQLVQQARSHPDLPLLVVAEETTAAAREILRDHGIGVVDGLGNAHVELPGLLVHLEPQRRAERARAAPPARLSGRAGVVAQALLRSPSRTWHVTDLADVAGVSAGLAHRVLARLEEEGVVSSTGKGPRRVRSLANPTALLDLWVEENVDRPIRTPGYVLAQTSRQLVARLGDDLGRQDIEYAVTGAAAGSILAPLVTAFPVVEVWTAAALPAAQLCGAVGAEQVSEGHNVVFLQGKDDLPLVFREVVGEVWIANRFRVYADLRRDPRRGLEQAENLRREVIGF